MITPLQQLQQFLPEAKLSFQALPAYPQMELLLLDCAYDDSTISEEQADKIGDDPPYWIFCWASGHAMVTEIMQQRIPVKGRVVADFGSGAGLVAIAAALAGAKRVYACEIDPMAVSVIRLNCQRNRTEVIFTESLDSIPEPLDLVLAADVLYEADNLKFLDWFLACSDRVVIADSRLKNLSHSRYEHYFTRVTTSFPDFNEAKANSEVRFYRSLIC